MCSLWQVFVGGFELRSETDCVFDRESCFFFLIIWIFLFVFLQWIIVIRCLMLWGNFRSKILEDVLILWALGTSLSCLLRENGNSFWNLSYCGWIKVSRLRLLFFIILWLTFGSLKAIYLFPIHLFGFSLVWWLY